MCQALGAVRRSRGWDWGWGGLCWVCAGLGPGGVRVKDVGGFAGRAGTAAALEAQG